MSSRTDTPALSRPLSRYLHSEMVMIVLKDCASEPFYLHKSLLGSASPELYKHVFNDMKEGLGNKLELWDVEKATMEHVLTWLYTGTYNPQDDYNTERRSYQNAQANHRRLGILGSELGQAGAHEQSGTPGLEQAKYLLVHAKVHVFTDRFNIPELKSLTMKNIAWILSHCGSYPQGKMRRDIASTIIYCLQNLPIMRMGAAVSKSRGSETNRLPEDLLVCLADYVNWALNGFRTDEAVFNTILENSDFTKLLLYRSQPVARPPWVPAGYT